MAAFYSASSPLPPGETGAMVSSTLKLGISILNGGNAEVQQVTRVGERVRVGVPKWLPGLPHPHLLPASSAENAGLSEGQEGSGLLPEYPGADADLQVGPCLSSSSAFLGGCVLLPWAIPVLLIVSRARESDLHRGVRILELTRRVSGRPNVTSCKDELQVGAIP